MCSQFKYSGCQGLQWVLSLLQRASESLLSPCDLKCPRPLPIFPPQCPCTTGGRQWSLPTAGGPNPWVTLALPAPGHAETWPEPSLSVPAPEVSLRETRSRPEPNRWVGAGGGRGRKDLTVEDGSLPRFGRNARGSWSSEQLSPRAREGLSSPFWSLAAPQRFGKK